MRMQCARRSAASSLRKSGCPCNGFDRPFSSPRDVMPTPLGTPEPRSNAGQEPANSINGIILANGPYPVNHNLPRPRLVEPLFPAFCLRTSELFYSDLP